MTKTIIYLASDHAGFMLKAQLVKFLARQAVDLGPATYQPQDDYPDYASRLARQVVKTHSRGILICRNGVGVCIAANKINGVRAVNACSVALAKSSRRDDDTNILCLGQDFVLFSQAKKIIATWLTTEFSGQKRHRRRLKKITALEHGQR